MIVKKIPFPVRSPPEVDRPPAGAEPMFPVPMASGDHGKRANCISKALQ